MSNEFEREIEAVIAEDDPEELLSAVIDISLAAENAEFMQFDDADKIVAAEAMHGCRLP